MSENGILQAILAQSSQAARDASACLASVEALDSRMDEHVTADRERYGGHDERLREVEVDVQDLKTTKDLAASAGRRAGLKGGLTVAALIVFFVEAAQALYTVVAG